MTPTIPPDTEGMNGERARAAQQALLLFARDFGETDKCGKFVELREKDLVHLLRYLAHFCDRNEMRMSNCIASARSHYLAETDNEGRQFSAIPSIEFEGILTDMSLGPSESE